MASRHVDLSLQKAQSSAEFYSLHVRPLAAETEAAVREAFQSSAVNAFELAELLETVARVRLEDLDVRYQHQRLRRGWNCYWSVPCRDSLRSTSRPARQMTIAASKRKRASSNLCEAPSGPFRQTGPVPFSPQLLHPVTATSSCPRREA